MQLVEHEVLPAHPFPIPVAPGESLREQDGRGPVDPLGLPERTGIGTLGAVAEPVGIATAWRHARLDVTVVAALLLLHQDLAPRRAVDQDEAHPLRLGCPDPPPDRTVPMPDRPASPRLPTLVPLIHGDCISLHSRGLPLTRPLALGLTPRPDPLAAGPLLARGPACHPVANRSGKSKGARMAAHAGRGGAGSTPRSTTILRKPSRIPHSATGHRTPHIGLYRLYMRSSWQIRLTAMPDDEVSNGKAGHGPNRAAVRPAFDAPSSPIRGIRSQSLETHVSPICKSRATSSARGERQRLVRDLSWWQYDRKNPGGRLVWEMSDVGIDRRWEPGMSYGYWGQVKEREPRAYDEKAYRRQNLAVWDARWHALSVQARSFFLNEVKGPVKKQKDSFHSAQRVDRQVPAPDLEGADRRRIRRGSTRPISGRSPIA